MERLWAPWRGSYVTNAGAQGGCFLCAAARGEDDSLVVARDQATVTLLNRYPYNPGHLMVAPIAHVSDLLAAGDDGAAALMVAVRRSMRALQAAMGPDGFNVGLNHGAPAGASVEHLHVHVVPRWAGDTNFMPVVGGTKVLPELLEQTAVRVRAAFSALE
jgi:ATP adenylyltransferase